MSTLAGCCAERPLLFLDVDGTLLPYDGARLPSTLDEWDSWQSPSNPQLTKVDRTHGSRLLALPCMLMWATAWMGDANKVISPLLGLAELPVAELPVAELPVAGLPDAPVEDERGVLHWKTWALVRTAAGRPFIWVDDEISDLDRSWVSAHHPGHALLHRVNSQTGVLDTDFGVLGDWLRDHHPQLRSPAAEQS
ncbi:hypothetical protein GCM10010277_82350 [Streptomyces longisporoflavus]|uniref:hypothetical protein n=1 Tax=Streptomyces longisporoflavus TaxID=28044 RepID=UPI00167DCC7C|nr:hypothetical protein [Streptomyces longisporoflavus]GGV70932.1 hypothetical protein GCM10010277_82350 [Streptomyces longisporoflavus]